MNAGIEIPPRRDDRGFFVHGANFHPKSLFIFDSSLTEELVLKKTVRQQKSCDPWHLTRKRASSRTPERSSFSRLIGIGGPLSMSLPLLDVPHFLFVLDAKRIRCFCRISSSFPVCRLSKS